MSKAETIRSLYPLEYVIQDLREWPINKLSDDKEQFMSEVVRLTKEKLYQQIETKQDYKREMQKLLYQERIRLTQTPWRADRPDEKEFWGGIKDKLLKMELDATDEPYDIREDELISAVLDRYIHEIVGNFDISIYKFAKSIIPHIFARLLNASPRRRRNRGLLGKKYSIHDKIKVIGDLDLIRELSLKGTIVMVPTHFSNLDSLVIGWLIETMGLPAFTYGAGLNLFGIKFLAYFMRRLGAYRLDRRKKNLIYLEMLKNYSTIAVHRGAHSLFFPGGTRSRSGSIDQQLKLGLLGTVVESQRMNFDKYPEEMARKIFIVPTILSYHFVLEAPALINNFLEREGKERFLIENDEYSTSYKMLKFIFKFLRASSDMTVSFAPPMDVFGNRVDREGNSYSTQGKQINIKDYFLSNEEMSIDSQRDGEYTRMLGQSIAASYQSHNVVLSSQLLAYTAFEIFLKKFNDLDIYGLLRLPLEDAVIDYIHFATVIDKLRGELKKMEQDKKVILSEELYLPIDKLIEHGLSNMDLYHTSIPLLKNESGQLTTEDMKLLLYYHNRLVGYNLDIYVGE